jgi:hypothetical protein
MIPSRTLLASDHCAAVASFWLVWISSRSEGRVWLLAELRDLESFSAVSRNFPVQLSWQHAWARASAMMAGWWNSIPNPRWMIGWKKPGYVSELRGP